MTNIPRLSIPVTCYSCQRQGHVISECPAKQKWDRQAVTSGHSQSEWDTHEVVANPAKNLTPPYYNVLLHYTTILLQLTQTTRPSIPTFQKTASSTGSLEQTCETQYSQRWETQMLISKLATTSLIDCMFLVYVTGRHRCPHLRNQFPFSRQNNGARQSTACPILRNKYGKWRINSFIRSGRCATKAMKLWVVTVIVLETLSQDLILGT